LLKRYAAGAAPKTEQQKLVKVIKDTTRRAVLDKYAKEGFTKLSNGSDIRVVKAVTGVDLGTKSTSVDIKKASDAFKSRFGQTWVDEQQKLLDGYSSAVASKAEQQKLLNAIRDKGTVLRDYGKHGFLDLDKELVKALKAEGVTWGGEWVHEKDIMHFEI
jgi:hypothetical protein